MLFPNDQQELRLPKGETLTFNTSGGFKITDEESTRNYTNEATYGPFEVDKKILIASGGSHLFVRFRSKLIAPSVVRQVGVIGTSLVNQCENINTSGKTGASSKSWLDWALSLGLGASEILSTVDNRVFTGWEPSGSGSRYFNGLNFGVSGQGIEEIWSRCRQVANFTQFYDLMLQDAGTNDMGNMGANRILFLKCIIAEYFASKGVVSVMLTVLARDTSSWASGSDERKKANFINNALRSFSSEFSAGVVLHDWNQDWVDSSDLDGVPRANFSVDGIHFAPAGALSVGRGLWDRTLSKYLAKGASRTHSPDDLYDSSINTQGCLNPNPRLLGVGGSTGVNASGDVSTNYTVENTTGSPAITVVVSKVSTDSGADANRLVFTLSGSQTEEFYYRTTPANITHAIGGSYVQPYCRLKFNNAPDSFNSIGLELIDQSNTRFRSTNIEPVQDGGGNEMPLLVESGDEFYLVGRPVKLTDDSDTIRLRLLMSMTGSGSVGASVDIIELAVRPISMPPSLTPENALYLR